MQTADLRRMLETKREEILREAQAQAKVLEQTIMLIDKVNGKPAQPALPFEVVDNGNVVYTSPDKPRRRSPTKKIHHRVSRGDFQRHLNQILPRGQKLTTRQIRANSRKAGAPYRNISSALCRAIAMGQVKAEGPKASRVYFQA